MEEETTRLPFGIELDTLVVGLIVSVVIVLVALLALWVIKRAIGRSSLEADQRFRAIRFSRVVVWVAAILGLVMVWRPLGGNLGPAIGLATAGFAFAMQEVIGAIAGWFNITFGNIFRVGDRIQMGNAAGDVIDISLLKTRLMEIGSPDTTSGIKSAQYTGRVVTVSNKASFTGPVHNYSSYFDYIWEEVEIAIPHHNDWQAADLILERTARDISSEKGAREAMADVRRRFPVPATEVEPEVFVSIDEDYVRLAARFVVPIRAARSVEDQLIRRIYLELEEAGIEIVSTRVIQNATEPWEPVTGSISVSGSGPSESPSR